MILLSARVRFFALCLGVALTYLFTSAASAQTNYYAANGTEYAVIGALPGDQAYPDTAVNPAGGLLVWQDNITDGSGWGISARRVDSTLSGTLSTFRVNQQGTNDQENPRVALFKNGGGVFVWQGGVRGSQHIFARFLTSANTFLTTTDLMVNPVNTHFQINPAVTTLNNSNVVVVWSSYNEAGSSTLQDVYGQILSPAGLKIGGEFLINQFTNFNQRTPAIAALTGGGFVVAWVSEQERLLTPTWGTNQVTVTSNPYEAANGIVSPSVDIYARLYNSSGTATGSEFIVNTDNNITATPTVAAASDGTFMVAWGAKDASVMDNSWDIYARSFSSGGAGGTAVRVNTHVYGDQYAPRVSSLGLDYLVVWTSLGQDGSREGVYGQSMRTGSALIGGEFRVNTTTLSQQMHPVVTSDGAQQFLVVWTSYTATPNGFDLYAERYANVASVLQPMSAPFVYAPFTLSNNIYQPQLQVSWPTLLGLSVSNYGVYLDGTNSPTVLVKSNQWVMTAVYGLSTNSTHSFQVDYTTTDGRHSPRSPSASGTTWSGQNWGGIPYEWMTNYYGSLTGSWPSSTAPLVKGGPSLLSVFLSGGNPNDSSTWLMQALTKTSQGLFLSWNTQPGATYQVQVSTSFGAWSNVGGPRFAAGSNDSVYVGGGSAGYYRIVLLR